jgi:hypothetical protein
MAIENHPNVKATLVEDGLEGEVLDSEKTIRDKIIHVLTIYPRISTSMLQIGVGTSLMPGLWKPILQGMIQEGIIIQERKIFKTPTDRDQSYTILSLNPDKLPCAI